MSNRFVSSFPPSIAGSPLQAEGSPAVPAVPGTDPTPSPRRPASPVALYGVGAHPAGCRRSPRPKFAELAQVSRGRAACPHHPRRLPHAAGTPQPAPQRRAGSPHPSIHPSIPAGALPAARSRSSSSSMHSSSSVYSSSSSSFSSAGRSSALGGSLRAQRDPGAAEAGGKPWWLPGRARSLLRKGRPWLPTAQPADRCLLLGSSPGSAAADGEQPIAGETPLPQPPPTENFPL